MLHTSSCRTAAHVSALELLLRRIALLPMCQTLRYMICGQTPWISPAPARRAWQSEAKRCCARPLLSSGMLIGPDRRKQMACPPDTMVRPAPAHREQCQDKDWNNPCIIGFAFNMYMTPCMLFWNMHMNPMIGGTDGGKTSTITLGGWGGNASSLAARSHSYSERASFTKVCPKLE